MNSTNPNGSNKLWIVEVITHTAPESRTALKQIPSATTKTAIADDGPKGIKTGAQTSSPYP